MWVGCGVCLTFARYVIILFSKRFKWVTSELCLRILWIWWGNPIMPWPWWRPLSKHFIIFYVWITLRWETSLETWVLGAFWMKRTIFFPSRETWFRLRSMSYWIIIDDNKNQRRCWGAVNIWIFDKHTFQRGYKECLFFPWKNKYTTMILPQFIFQFWLKRSKICSMIFLKRGVKIGCCRRFADKLNVTSVLAATRCYYSIF